MESNYRKHLKAKVALRREPELTDAEVAEKIGLHPLEAEKVVSTARADLQADTATVRRMNAGG